MKKLLYILIVFFIMLASLGVTTQALAANSVDIVSVEYPRVVGPGKTILFKVVVKINSGQLLESRGDMLRNTDGNLFGHWPHIPVVGTHNAAGNYTFVSYQTMVAPMSEGTYHSKWRVWQNGAYVGDDTDIAFQVQNGAGGGDLPVPPPYKDSGSPCNVTKTVLHEREEHGRLEHSIELTIPYGDVQLTEANTGARSDNWGLLSAAKLMGEPIDNWHVGDYDEYKNDDFPIAPGNWRIYVPTRLVGTYTTQLPLNGTVTFLGPYRNSWLTWRNHPEQMGKKIIYLRCKNQVTLTSYDQLAPVLTGLAIVSPTSGTQLSYQVEIQPWMAYIQTSLNMGSKATITLVAPDGTVYSRTNSAVTYTDTPSFAVHTLNLATPQGGTWQVIVDVISAESDSVFMLNVNGKQVNVPSNDNIPPVTGMHFDGTKGLNGWFVSDVAITLSAEDNPGGSGVKEIEWSTDNGATWQKYTGPFVISQEGLSYVLGRSRDNAGNYDQSLIGKFLSIDKTPPVTTLALEGTLGNNGWYVSDVTGSLSATDNMSGVADTYYSIDGGEIVPGTTFTIEDDGIHTVQFYSQDWAGNIEPSQTITIKVDQTPPVVIPWTDQTEYTRVQPFVVHYTCTDPQPGSGIANCTATFNDQSVQDGQTMDLFWLDLGSYSLNPRGEDNAGWVTTNSASFQLIATIESLQGTVERLCKENYINKKGICNSLGQKLDAALAAQNRGRFNVAVNILQAFQHEVNAQTGKAIKLEAARILLMDSNYVIELLH